MNHADEHKINFNSYQLDDTAKKILELFNQLDEKQQERALWMIQGYNLGQKMHSDKVKSNDETKL